MDLNNAQQLAKDGRLAHVIIDPQKKFAHANRHARTTANTILKTDKTLSQKNIPTFVVYMDPLGKRDTSALGGLLDGLEKRILIPKTMSDATIKTNLIDNLHEHGIHGVLTSGYNAEACYFHSTTSLREHFEVAGLIDCVGSAYYKPHEITYVIKLIQSYDIGIFPSKDICN